MDPMAWRKYVSLAELYGFLGGIYVQVRKCIPFFSSFSTSALGTGRKVLFWNPPAMNAGDS